MSREGPTARITSVVSSIGGNGSLRRQRALVIGGGHVGRTLASHLHEDYDVAFVSRNLPVVERTTREDVTAHYAEEITANALDEADADDASLAIVASAEESVNFLVAQLLRIRFGVENVVIRVDDREKLDSFEDLDVETVCVPDLLVAEVTERLESAAEEIAED